MFAFCTAYVRRRMGNESGWNESGGNESPMGNLSAADTLDYCTELLRTRVGNATRDEGAGGGPAEAPDPVMVMFNFCLDLIRQRVSIITYYCYYYYYYYYYYHYYYYYYYCYYCHLLLYWI